MAIEQQHSEKFFVNPQSAPIEADRREATLVQSFCAYVKRVKGLDPVRKQILAPGEVKPLFTDIFIEEINLLIEAKGTTERGSIRMALGQLADYRRFLKSPRCAILVPSQPRRDLLDLAKTEGIGVFWPSANGFEGTDDLW